MQLMIYPYLLSLIKMRRRDKVEVNAIEKYAKLYEACKKYPVIVLSSLEKRGRTSTGKDINFYKEPEVRAKGGFIEKFCR